MHKQRSMDGLPFESHENLPYGNFAGMGDMWSDLRDKLVTPTLQTAGVQALSLLAQTPGGQQVIQQSATAAARESGYKAWDWIMTNPKKAAIYAALGIGGISLGVALVLRGLKK